MIDPFWRETTIRRPCGPIPEPIAAATAGIAASGYTRSRSWSSRSARNLIATGAMRL